MPHATADTYDLTRLPDDIRGLIDVDDTSGCWRYMGRTTRDGYGLCYAEGRSWVTHRYVYTQLVGPIPTDHVLDHLRDGRSIAAGPCKHRDCCNPAHVEPVTVTENSRRVVTFNSTKTQCRRGHDYATHGIARVCGDGRTRRYCTLCEGGKAARKGVA